jgi:hypothetical protein
VEFILLFVLLVIVLLNKKLTTATTFLAEKIVCWTAKKLPDEIQDRYEQDWLADLDDHTSGFYKLWFASGLIWGVKKLRQESQNIAGRFTTVPVKSTGKRRTSYLKRASKRFLKGTSFKTPSQAVEAGIRTLEEWVLTLAEEREVELQYLEARPLRKVLSERRSRK